MARRQIAPLPRSGRGKDPLRSSGRVRARLGARVVSALLLLSAPALAADLPAATQALLRTLGMPASVLDGLDAELAVPPSWIDAARRREGKLRINGTWEPKEEDQVLKPFRARYPFLAVTYARASRQDRSLRPLIALKEGRVLVDVVSGLGSAITAYREAGALLPLADLPGYKTLPPALKAADGLWVGHQMNYWCTAYNTKKIKPADMPPHWEGLLDPARWGDGRVGVGNRANLWLLPLEDVKGQKWAESYATDLFEKLKPQRRKEGANALLNLVMLGEFDLAIPVAQYRLGGAYGKEAPVAWHCPDPVPTTVQGVAVLKQTASPNAARLYVNWLLSREGQLAQYEAVNAAPSHPALQDPHFLSFAAEIAGKEHAFRSPELLEQKQWKDLQQRWNRLWEGSGAGP
jgi:iron(III) transport system substrate-binding protein